MALKIKVVSDLENFFLRARSFILGGLTAGVAWASFEVFWTVNQPLLPWNFLRAQKLLPPQDLLEFLAVAVATYGTLGAIIAVIGYTSFRRTLSKRPPVAQFSVATCVTFGIFGAVGIVVWTTMLMKGGLLHPGTLLVFGIGIAVFAGIMLLVERWMRAQFSSVMLAALSIGIVLPTLIFIGTSWAHQQIDYPDVLASSGDADKLPNIILVTIDTLRADHVGAYSNGKIKTPTIDRLADEGVLFSKAFSQIPHTTPSHVSIFTSVYPFAHGAKNGVPMRSDLTTLPQALKQLGYHTVAFVSAYTTRSNVTGLGSSFDLYVDSLNPYISFLSADEVEPLIVFRLLERLSGNQIAAPVVNKRVRSWLSEQPTEPFFAWVHYFDPHKPYAPIPEFRALYSAGDESRDSKDLALYDAEITYTDAQLSILLDELRSEGMLEDAIIVITSDHGEAFGEPHPHVERGHGEYLYDPTIWVPLIVWSPNRISGKRIANAVVETTDVAPTILDMIGAEIPASFGGRSMLPLIEDNGSTELRLGFSQTSGFSDSQWYSVRSKDAKLHTNPKDGKEELFDLRSDPLETKNIAAEQPELLEEYRSYLSTFLKSGAGDTTEDQLDPETIRRLKALGYLGGDT